MTKFLAKYATSELMKELRSAKKWQGESCVLRSCCIIN